MRTLIVIALLLSLVSPARGEGAKETLRGLEGVAVVVQLDKGATQAGLTAESLKTAVEERLRRNGVAVVESAAPPAQRTVLTVRIAARQLPSSTVSMFSLSLEIVQVVKLVRDEKIVGLGTTWNASSMGVGEQPEVREALDASLDRLSTDWKAVHPREKGALETP